MLAGVLEHARGEFAQRRTRLRPAEEQGQLPFAVARTVRRNERAAETARGQDVRQDRDPLDGPFVDVESGEPRTIVRAIEAHQPERVPAAEADGLGWLEKETWRELISADL